MVQARLSCGALPLSAVARGAGLDFSREMDRFEGMMRSPFPERWTSEFALFIKSYGVARLAADLANRDGRAPLDTRCERSSPDPCQDHPAPCP
jgi:hypothetical protein